MHAQYIVRLLSEVGCEFLEQRGAELQESQIYYHECAELVD